MTPSERLFARIRAELPEVDLPAGAVLRRTNAGRHQRACGAWSWFATDERGSEWCGSQYRVSDLLACPTLVAYCSVPGGTAPEIIPPGG